MTAGEKRAASVLRQQLMLALVELAAEVGRAEPEAIASRAAGLDDVRDITDRFRVDLERAKHVR